MSDDTPAVDITSFDRTDNLNSEQLRGAREANATAQRYFSPPLRPATSAAASQARYMRPTPGSAANTVASNARTRSAAINIEQAAQAVRTAQSGLSSGASQALRGASQSASATTSSARAQQVVRNAGFAQQLSQARAIGGPIPQTAPAPAAPPTAPPAPPGAPPGGAGGLSSGPFGPGHPFYATLTPPKPTSYPTAGRPVMPTQAPTAGLDTSQKFLATPGGKLVTSAVSSTVDAVGKALAEAAKPRQSMPDGLNTGSGWRSN